MNAGRITSNMLSRALIGDIDDLTNRLASTQRKLSTGKELTRPSDDPFATGRALSLRSEIEGLHQYQRTVQDATGWQDVSDAALSSISDAAQRARELLIQGASDTAGQTARNSLAQEIDQLIESVKQAANTSYGGRFVFSGAKTSTRPYDPGADVYNGDGAAMAREIGPSVSIQVNVTAGSFLGDGQAANDGKLLDTLRDIAQHLRGGTAADANALRSADLKGLDANLDTLGSVRASVGATTNRLQAADARLAQLEESTSKLLSNTEDADMAKTMIDFSTQQSIYQAALRSGASIVQGSLLDFLR
jgi:flagellar hook-associated protein 3 FlgL